MFLYPAAHARLVLGKERVQLRLFVKQNIPNHSKRPVCHRRPAAGQIQEPHLLARQRLRPSGKAATGHLGALHHQAAALIEERADRKSAIETGHPQRGNLEILKTVPQRSYWTQKNICQGSAWDRFRTGQGDLHSGEKLSQGQSTWKLPAVHRRAQEPLRKQAHWLQKRVQVPEEKQRGHEFRDLETPGKAQKLRHKPLIAHLKGIPAWAESLQALEVHLGRQGSRILQRRVFQPKKAVWHQLRRVEPTDLQEPISRNRI